MVDLEGLEGLGGLEGLEGLAGLAGLQGLEGDFKENTCFLALRMSKNLRMRAF